MKIPPPPPILIFFEKMDELKDERVVYVGV